VTDGGCSSYVGHLYPNLLFYFWPSFIAFPFDHIYALAEALFAEIKNGKPQLLNLILFDPQLAHMIAKPSGERTFVEMLAGLERDQSGLYLEQNRFPPTRCWPTEINAALKEGKTKQ
jgi:hypothetical protein